MSRTHNGQVCWVFAVNGTSSAAKRGSLVARVSMDVGAHDARFVGIACA